MVGVRDSCSPWEHRYTKTTVVDFWGLRFSRFEINERSLPQTVQKTVQRTFSMYRQITDRTCIQVSPPGLGRYLAPSNPYPTLTKAPSSARVCLAEVGIFHSSSPLPAQANAKPNLGNQSNEYEIPARQRETANDPGSHFFPGKETLPPAKPSNSHPPFTFHWSTRSYPCPQLDPTATRSAIAGSGKPSSRGRPRPRPLVAARCSLEISERSAGLICS